MRPNLLQGGPPDRPPLAVAWGGGGANGPTQRWTNLGGQEKAAPMINLLYDLLEVEPNMARVFANGWRHQHDKDKKKQAC